TYEWAQEGKAAYLREAQFEASRRIPNSGYVSTADLALPHESRQIHPPASAKSANGSPQWP
ncbi:MAG: hypothetical protein K2I43_04185, partial [Alistipes sp.]|nr:hypothetical protein [Alistipes sp.]